jgi:hypothetical protein
MELVGNCGRKAGVGVGRGGEAATPYYMQASALHHN